MSGSWQMFNHHQLEMPLQVNFPPRGFESSRVFAWFCARSRNRAAPLMMVHLALFHVLRQSGTKRHENEILSDAQILLPVAQAVKNSVLYPAAEPAADVRRIL